MRRTVASNAYLTVVAALVIESNVWAWPYDLSHPDPIAMVVYLAVGAATLNLVYIGIDRGGLTLALLLIGAGTLSVNPLDATVIGIAAQIPQPRPIAWRIAVNGVV
jgi:hypothetical protein